MARKMQDFNNDDYCLVDSDYRPSSVADSISIKHQLLTDGNTVLWGMKFN
jgi:ACT domain-containing protein